jgi:hypothetical protein
MHPELDSSIHPSLPIFIISVVAAVAPSSGPLISGIKMGQTKSHVVL